MEQESLVPTRLRTRHGESSAHLKVQPLPCNARVHGLKNMQNGSACTRAHSRMTALTAPAVGDDTNLPHSP